MIPALQHIGEPHATRRRGRSIARRTADALAGAVREVLENEETASAPGLLQRLDPRVKLASAVMLAVAASFLHTIGALAALIVATMAVAVASRIPLPSFAAKLWGSVGLFALLLSAPAATAWITPGPVLVPAGPLSITAPGLLVATRLIFRVAAGAGFGLLVVWTTRWSDLLRGLSALGLPDLVVATLAMTQKQIMSLLRTIENMHLARESRMLTAGHAAGERDWVVGRMAFVAQRSLKTADEVYDAMLARGFSGRMPCLVELRAGVFDLIWFAGTAGACAALLVLDRMVLPL